MTITILGTILLLALLGYVLYQTTVVRKKAYISLLNQKTEICIACAGSDSNTEVVRPSKDIPSLEHNVFKDKDGRILNPNDYRLFVVQGESMQFCGIHNNDVIFTDVKFNIKDNTKFPIILVLRKHHLEEENKAKYKIRRTWMKYRYVSKEDLIEVVANTILPSPKFQEIRQLDAYDGDDALIQDLQNERIQMYEKKYINSESPNDNNKEIIISTTFHTTERKIRFSIHPISIIEGEVIASFTIQK